jgi:ADP-ribose pyrophosphatase
MKTIINQSKYLRFVKEGTWEYVERTTGKDVVYIIPLLKEHGQDYLIFTEEYRIPVHSNVLSFPAGLIGDINKEECIIDGAARELEEETGYKANILTLLTKGPISPGLSDETLHFYLANITQKVGDGGGDELENIKVHKVPINNTLDYLKEQERDGLLVDPKVYIGIYFIQQLKKYIFP